MKIDVDIQSKYSDIAIVIQAPKMNDEVSAILKKLEEKQETRVRPTISGKHEDKIYIVDPTEIYLIYSMAGKTYAATKEKKLVLKQPLYSLEELLEANKSFVRISKSAIVNIRAIKNIAVSFNGALVVKFPNGLEEVISRRYVKKFKEFINIGGNNE
jgi:DNA-binding LytR/AlgR family response regulator